MSIRSGFVVAVDAEDCNIQQQRCENHRSQKMEVMYTILDLITCSNTLKTP